MFSIARIGRMKSGFTLTEMLVVIFLIGILASLILTISSGVFEKGNRSRAKAELEAISLALESYRQRLGDYPEVTTGRELFLALEGRIGPKGLTLSPPFPPFLESGKFDLGDPDNPVLLDPWEHPYEYHYIEPVSALAQSGFRLFSRGPDGKSSVAGDSSSQDDEDNIWPDD